MSSEFPARAIVLLTLAAVIWHGVWSRTLPAPIDWDPAYYLDVARNIVAGRGAVSGAVWHLSGPDLPLPLPADLHWMPLPSRVLVPFVAMGGDRGALWVSVLLAACWVPLAARLAQRLGGTRSTIVQAAVWAGLAGGYVRFLSSPDSMGLYGCVAGVGWLAAMDGRVALTVAAAAAAAWTRGDGFLLAPCLALVLWRGQRRGGAAITAVAGPLAAVAWWARCAQVAGDAWWTAREQTASALHIHQLLLGTAGSLGVSDRMAGLGEVARGGLGTGLVVGLGLLPVLALAGGWLRRREPLVQGLGTYALCMVVVPGLLAPGVSASGSVFRSGAAVFPAACALAVIALDAVGRWAQRKRDYPPLLLPLLCGVGFALGSIGLGVGMWKARPGPPVTCHATSPDAVVFSGRPLLVRAVCGPPAVALFRGEAPEEVADRAERHGIYEAWLPDTDPDPLVPTKADAAHLLPGWTLREHGVWQRPVAPSSTVAPRGW